MIAAPIVITCRNCGAVEELTDAEVAQNTRPGRHLPVYCSACRTVNRTGAGRYLAVCSDCGVVCKTPFKPGPGRTAPRCQPCYQALKASLPRRVLRGITHLVTKGRTS